MKFLKFIPLLLILIIFNSNAYAAQDCSEIKGNIVGKLFCKAKYSYGTESSGTGSSASTEDSDGWKIWKKPEWMKKKN